MTLEYVATPHVARIASRREVGAVSIWLSILAVVNLAAALTVALASCPAWVFFVIFMVDAATVVWQSRRVRACP